MSIRIKPLFGGIGGSQVSRVLELSEGTTAP
jgi:hypothetical protein